MSGAALKSGNGALHDLPEQHIRRLCVERLARIVGVYNVLYNAALHGRDYPGACVVAAEGLMNGINALAFRNNVGLR